MPASKDHLLRIAVVGSGPAGFYAAERLLKEPDLSLEIDMFDRLPTPYGLVRGGVAPDHQKIKSVTKVYERIASQEGFRFYGNVDFGIDLKWSDLTQYYHAAIFAVGTQDDRKLDIPGEDLLGSHGATEFVAWYNAHPDYRHLEFDLYQEAVAVIGVGNVAMDVARILARSESELNETDIADYALAALAKSNVRTIYIIGRRGPAQVKFTNPEIKELGEMEEAEVVIAPEEIDLDPISQAYIDSGKDKVAVKNIDYMIGYSKSPSQGKKKKLVFKFLKSPVELIGTHRVEAIRLERNVLYEDDQGNQRNRGTGEYETLPVGLVFRSVGYMGKPLPDIPFYEKWGIIPNEKGRIMTAAKDGEPFTGGYVAGWIKRGPSGVIGTNKPDSIETAESVLEDLRIGNMLKPDHPSSNAIEKLLNDRNVRYVTFADWLILDQLEIERGQAVGRPRLKFNDVDTMLSALEKHKSQPVA